MNNTFSTEFLKIFTGHNINWHTLYICVCVCVCMLQRVMLILMFGFLASLVLILSTFCS